MQNGSVELVMDASPGSEDSYISDALAIEDTLFVSVSENSEYSLWKVTKDTAYQCVSSLPNNSLILGLTATPDNRLLFYQSSGSNILRRADNENGYEEILSNAGMISIRNSGNYGPNTLPFNDQLMVGYDKSRDSLLMLATISDSVRLYREIPVGGELDLRGLYKHSLGWSFVLQDDSSRFMAVFDTTTLQLDTVKYSTGGIFYFDQIRPIDPLNQLAAVKDNGWFHLSDGTLKGKKGGMGTDYPSFSWSPFEGVTLGGSLVFLSSQNAFTATVSHVGASGIIQTLSTQDPYVDEFVAADSLIFYAHGTSNSFDKRIYGYNVNSGQVKLIWTPPDTDPIYVPLEIIGRQGTKLYLYYGPDNNIGREIYSVPLPEVWATEQPVRVREFPVRIAPAIPSGTDFDLLGRQLKGNLNSF